MSHSKRPRRRVLGPLALAVVLASESAGLALAAHLDRTEFTLAPVADSCAQPSFESSAGGLVRAATNHPSTSGDGRSRSSAPAMAAERLLGRERAPHVRPDVNRGARSRPELQSAPRAAAPGSAATRYHGRNHLWIPALKINRSVAAFPCSRSRPPDNLVYRWGCAGKNNVYLLGHAYSVFAPLHDAYVEGRLHKGMEVVYADGNGRIRTYAVAWWRLTRPTSAASWAWAAQSRPSMTLQTCVGADSAYRLIVRLVARP